MDRNRSAPSRLAIAVRSSSGTNTSVRRVSTTSTPGSFSSSASSRLATSSTSSASDSPRPFVPGSCPPWPGSITMRLIPSPSCRDNEKRPSTLAEGAAGAGSVGRAELAATAARRPGRGVAAGAVFRAGRHRRSRPYVFVGRDAHALCGCIAAGAWAPARARRPARTARVDRGRGLEQRWRRRRRVDGRDNRRRRAGAPIDVDDDAIRVVEREDGMTAGALQVEHDARGPTGPRLPAARS